jgi:DNA replication and repair protein RecF
MFLQELSVLNFKNYAEAGFTFTRQVNCFVGNNGEGKTNLLDAIHYLSFCKSFFNPIDTQNIMDDAPFFVIQGVFNKGEERDEIYCGLKRNEKKQFKRNKKEYSRLSDHIGLFPLVMISPADSELVYEGSETRRKFIDSVISQYNKEYLDLLIRYNKVLAQRNALLKKFAELRYFDAESLEVWDVQLAERGNRIHRERKKFLEAFVPVFNSYFEFISGGKEQVELSYYSQLHEAPLEKLLHQNIAKDQAAQYTTAGIHKDDLDFMIDGRPLKKFGSQGQQKSFLIALKLAQFDIIKKEKGVTPILLLDDIYDRLDELRIKQLMELVSGTNFGQIFITDTHRDRLAKVLKAIKTEFSLFNIKEGQLVN